MKKLMITVALTCMAIFANAAALNWYTAGHDGIYDPMTDDYGWLNSGAAYLVLVTDSDNFSVTSDGTKLSLAGGEIVDSVAFVDGEAQHAWQGTGDLVNGTTYSFAMIGTTDGVVGYTLPTTGNYGVDDADGTFYNVVWNAATGASFENADGFAVNTAIEGSSPIPEPTSGLLMLLGMAGLALRRRRA